MKKIIFLLVLQTSLNSFAQITFERDYLINHTGYAADAYVDSNSYILGGMFINQTQYNPVLIKTDLYGDTIWTKIIQGVNGSSLYAMTKTNDSGYVFMSSYSNNTTKSDLYLTRTDRFGGVLWTNSIVKPRWDIGRAIIQTSDDYYIIAGETNSYYPYSYDAYTVKTDPFGNSTYTKNYGQVNAEDYAYDVIETTNSNYVFVGHGEDYGVNNYQIYLIKQNPIGDTLWTRNIGNTFFEYGRSIKQALDNNYIITGKRASANWNSDVYLIKTDTNGYVLWEKTYDFNTKDIGEKIVVLDNGYLIAGKTNDGLLLIRTNNLGDTLWTRIIQLENPITILKSIDKCTDNGYLMTGWSKNHKLTLLKTDSIGCIKPYAISITGEQNVSLNDTITYNNNSIRGSSYFWFSTSGNIVSGQNFEKADIYWDQIGIDTIYSVTYNACGSDTIIFIVNVDSCVVPNISAIQGRFDYLKIGNQELYYVDKIEGKKPLNFIWSINIGNIVSGQGTDSVIIEWITDGIDDLMVIAENDCGSDTSSGAISIILNEISVIPDSNNLLISAYPVPTNNVIYLNLPFGYDSFDVEIMDICGKQKYSNTMLSGLNKINLTNLSRGIYFMKIKTKYKIVIKKIILTK